MMELDERVRTYLAVGETGVAATLALCELVKPRLVARARSHLAIAS